MYNTLPSGIYPPLPTFFDAHDELDLPTLRRHIQHLADSGIAGYVLMGSNGEAVHLMDDERAQVITTAREIVGENSSMPIIVGCGDQSTRATILDLDAATICALAEHPNIIGVKDSAGNVAKLAQIVASVPSLFHVFAGSAGYLLPALAVGAVGAVAALANVFPNEVCDIQALFEAGQLEDARILQASLIPANAAVTTIYSVPGLKAALEYEVGYGGKPRMPLQTLTTEEQSKLQDILRSVHEDV